MLSQSQVSRGPPSAVALSRAHTNNLRSMPRAGPFSSAVLLQRPLTPVSEAESDTTTVSVPTLLHDSSSSGMSSGSCNIYEQRLQSSKALKFSRPRPVAFLSTHAILHDPPQSRPLLEQQELSRHNVHTASLALPDEPTFDLTLATTTFEHKQPEIGDSSGGEFLGETHMKDMGPVHTGLAGRAMQTYQPSILSKHAVDQPPTTPQQTRSAGLSTVASETCNPKYSQELMSKAESEEAEWEGEDVRSHHTVSEDGDLCDRDSMDQLERWQSSTYDISVFTDKQRKRLRKKGISPALYLEMKTAREGRGKWFNPLAGNTYLS